MCFYFNREMCHNYADRMANSVDPDQTAPADRMANSVDPDQTAPSVAVHCLPRPVCPKT